MGTAQSISLKRPQLQQSDSNFWNHPKKNGVLIDDIFHSVVVETAIAEVSGVQSVNYGPERFQKVERWHLSVSVGAIIPVFPPRMAGTATTEQHGTATGVPDVDRQWDPLTALQHSCNEWL